ncbi:MAG: hypothetical protein AB7K09_24000 [Planctomycetota bacterium]
MLEFTVYCCRDNPVVIDEVRERLARFGLPATVMQDAEEGATTARWFITLEEDPTSEEDTMLDAQMVVLDVSSDKALVRGAAMSLLMGFEGADDGEDIAEIKARLKKSQQSFFCSVTPTSSGLRILQIATLAACLDAGDGVLHDGTREEYYPRSTIANFLKAELGDDAEALLAAIR